MKNKENRAPRHDCAQQHFMQFTPFGKTAGQNKGMHTARSRGVHWEAAGGEQ